MVPFLELEKVWELKVKNKILLLLLFLVTSCSPSYERLTWLDKYKEIKETTRSIATGDEECFLDQFEISKIKAEIPKLEKNFTKRIKLSSDFDFAKFKNAETHYIKRFKKYMTLNELGKTCSDLPCILNTAYGRKNGEEGYRIYHWFLTMGSGISTSKLIPGYRIDDTKELKDYLFPNKELKLLNITSKTISKKYRDLLVSTLHRFPNGTFPGTGIAGLYSYSWSYTSTTTTRNPGTIFFTKQNISLNNKDKKVYGYYNSVIIHEHSHALDYTYGPVNSAKGISAGKKWTDLSWKWGEVTNTYIVQQKDGHKVEEERTEMRWIPDDTKPDGFVRAYQRTNPAEDFADSGAHFIISPEEFKKKSPKKYEWYKKDFYFNYGTTKVDFVEERSKEIATVIKNGLWETVKTCLIDKSIEPTNNGKVKLNGFNFIEKNILNCLEMTIENEIEKELFFVKRDQYLGCNYLQTKENEIYDKVVSYITPVLTGLIDKTDDFKEVQKVWGLYRNELKTKCDPTHIYLHIRNEEQSEMSYSTELAECVNHIYEKYTKYGELFVEEKQVYLDAHPFKKIEEDTIFAFSKMMKGFKTYLEREAFDLVDMCSVIKDEPLQTTGPVYGRGLYVNASVLNCINKEFHRSLDEQLSDFLTEKDALNTDALLYLTEHYTKQYIDLLNQALFDRNKTELAIYQNSLIEQRTKIFDKIIMNMNHLGSLYNSEKQIEYCQLNTSMMVSEKIKKIWESQGWPLTISLNETTNQVIDKLCPELIQKATEEYTKEYNTLNLKVEEFIESQLKTSNSWINGLDNEENFVTKCSENKMSDTENFAKGITSKNQLYFVNNINLSQKTVQILCEKLQTRFSSQLNKIRGQSEIYAKSIKTVLAKDLLWQVVPNKTEYLKSCMLAAQIKVDRSFVKSDNNLKEFNLVSVQLISKYLASNACEQMFKEWESSDLQALLGVVSKSDPFSYISTFNSLHNRREYMLEFYTNILLQLDHIIQKKFDEVYASCKEKYPYVRFASMKFNRKKCLEVFFKSMEAKDYNIKFNSHSKYHPLVKEAVLAAGKLKLDKLQKNLDQYLK